MRFCLPLLVMVTLALAGWGCGDDDQRSASAPSPMRTSGPTRSRAADEPEPTHLLAANGNRFNVTLLTAEPRQDVVLLFVNGDPAPHNVAIYDTPEANEEIFVGDTITGPEADIDYEFEAPSQRGTYFFRCDVHPTEMTGEFVVE